MKQLSPILKHFTVRVGEDMEVIEKPHDVHIASLQGSQDHGKLWDQYNTALELVQMPRVMEFVEAYRKMIEGTEREYFEKRNCEAFIYSCEYLDFAKQAPALWMYIPTGEDGKPMEKPKNYDQWQKKTLNTPYDQDLAKYEAYESALAKVLFYGWEVVDIGALGIQIACGFSKPPVSIIDRPNGVVFNQGYYTFHTLEDAFIACPHYLQLEKLK